MIEISNIKTNEIETTLALCQSVFDQFDENLKGYIDDVSDWELSFKISRNQQIIGFYLFWENNIADRNFAGKKGIEGIALGIIDRERGKGLGKLLIKESLQRFHKDYDYIFGKQLHILNNLNDWRKRRFIYDKNEQFSTTYQWLKGITKIPLVYQPNLYSCGNACIKMVLEYLNRSKQTTVKHIIDICGTNMEYGTRDIEMQKGLEYFKIPHKQNTETRTDSEHLQYLSQILHKGNVFFLRTLMSGSKHWIIVCGKINDVFYINDPSQGMISLSTAQIIQIWKPRSYDGFEVNLDKIESELHPQ